LCCKSDATAPASDETQQKACTAMTASSRLIRYLTVLGSALLSLYASGCERRPPAQPRPVEPRGELAEFEKTTIRIFENAAPSVVYITSLAVRREAFGLNIFDIPQKGTGSGFIWDADGHIVTNFHVVQDASAVEVTLSDHSSWPADTVGAEPDKDLAVVRIRAPSERLRPIAVGRSADLQVGQAVFAIGNPFGLDQTLTTGIVSALGRSIQAVTGRTIHEVIQTDAAINPGNSGGPLLDSAGRLIGVNTAIYSPAGVSSGIGFAVPVDIVNRVVPQLIQNGRMTRPVLGVALAEDALARRAGIQGVLIMNVEDGLGAAAAGLRGTRQGPEGDFVLGDIIQEVDGVQTRSRDDLLNVLERHQPGDVVNVKVLRGEQTLNVDVRLS
jgi:S1-C subfamily serine protease